MSPEISKPEWFQLADADTPAPKLKGKRAVRIMALATPLLVLGAGLVFAQTQDSPTAVASAATSTASTTDPIALSSTPAATPTSAGNAVQVSQVAATSPSPSITIKKPGIKMPTGGADDSLRNSDDD